MSSLGSGFYGINNVNVNGETSDLIYCSLFDNNPDNGTSSPRVSRFNTAQETFPMAVRSDGITGKFSYIRTPVAGIYEISGYMQGTGNQGALLVSIMYARSNCLFDANGDASYSLSDPNVRALCRATMNSSSTGGGVGGCYASWRGFLEKDQYVFNVIDLSGPGSVVNGVTYAYFTLRCLEAQNFPSVNAL